MLFSIKVPLPFEFALIYQDNARMRDYAGQTLKDGAGAMATNSSVIRTALSLGF